jgi:hypothetical protein
MVSRCGDCSLIEKGASVNLTDDKYKATPLQWALHGWGDPPPPGGDGGRHHQVVARLVAAGAQVDPAMLASLKVLADFNMLSALQGGHACHD